MIVVADTTPLNYLVVIGHVDLLPALFGQVLIPTAVWNELQDILREGARRKLLNLPTALGALQQTSFFISLELIQSLLDEDSRFRQQQSEPK